MKCRQDSHAVLAMEAGTAAQVRLLSYQPSWLGSNEPPEKEHERLVLEGTQPMGRLQMLLSPFILLVFLLRVDSSPANLSKLSVFGGLLLG